MDGLVITIFARHFSAKLAKRALDVIARSAASSVVSLRPILWL
jgi:hypothetical protein